MFSIEGGNMSPSTSSKPQQDLDLGAVLKKNDKVDSPKLVEALKLLEELDSLGIPDTRYDLVLPFTRQAHVSESSRLTSRSIEILQRQ